MSKLQSIPDVEGKTVLDIGGYDGLVALWCLGKKAARVIVVDSEQWRSYDNWPEPKQNNQFEFHKCDLFEWKEPADVVICFNVLYHVEDVYGVLKHLRYLTKETLCLCTASVVASDNNADQAVWKIYNVTEGHPHPASAATIFWKPTRKGLEVLLTRVGFDFEYVGTNVGDELVYRCSPKKAQHHV